MEPYSKMDWWLGQGYDVGQKALGAAVILIFGWLLSVIVAKVLRNVFARSRFDIPDLLEGYVVKLLKGIIWVVAAIMALSEAGLQTGPLIAGLGVTGFILGFAMQQTVGNLVAGFMVLLYQPYDVGHFVEIGGVSGTVEEMNLSVTSIRGSDNVKVVIPNGKIWGDVIRNNSELATRRLELELQIGYEANIDRVKEILFDLFGQDDMVLEDPSPVVRADKWDDYSVNLVLWIWCERQHLMDLKDTLIREIKEKLMAEGIDMSPNPQFEIAIKENDELENQNLPPEF